MSRSRVTLATIDAQAMEWQQRVAADDRRVLDAERADRLAVDEHVVGRDREPRERAAHREHRGVIDVDAVDLAHRRRAERHAEARSRIAPASLSRSARRELLGVVDAADGARVGRHDDGACDDGAREGAPSDFIDSGDERASRARGDLARACSSDAALRRREWSAYCAAVAGLRNARPSSP